MQTRACVISIGLRDIHWLAWYPLACLHGLKQKYFQHCDVTNCPAPRIENVPNRDTTVSYRTEPWILWTVTPLIYTYKSRTQTGMHMDILPPYWPNVNEILMDCCMQVLFVFWSINKAALWLGYVIWLCLNIVILILCIVCIALEHQYPSQFSSSSHSIQKSSQDSPKIMGSIPNSKYT